jgi:hypothetical protein
LGEGEVVVVVYCLKVCINFTVCLIERGTLNIAAKVKCSNETEYSASWIEMIYAPPTFPVSREKLDVPQQKRQMEVFSVSTRNDNSTTGRMLLSGQ